VIITAEDAEQSVMHPPLSSGVTETVIPCLKLRRFASVSSKPTISYGWCVDEDITFAASAPLIILEAADFGFFPS
jgi:hypothetical protein